MDNPIQHFWEKKLAAVKKTFEGNNFEVHVAETPEAANILVAETIIPALAPKRISWGGSLTFTGTGLYDRLKSASDMEVLDTFDKSLPREESLERRRQALLTDVFITGTNALTETGKMVNLDMIGNRVAAMAYGPRAVIILAGRNKIVPDVDAAVERIKTYAAPVNTMRLDKKTPCAETGECHECASPDRICNTWVITEKSFPKARIKLVLINEDMGF
ncbi:MAG: lactate utilization protein [Thermodesulfobacteriota bacterium]|nr:lactate utilization protein [Thermodesulfobacteriota bacterium]